MANNQNSPFASPGYAEIDGRTLFTSTSLNLTRSTISNDVNTILDEACGYAQGTVKYVLDIASPVTGAGFEIDWFALCERGEVYQLRFVLLRPDGGIAHDLLLRGVFRDLSAGPQASSGATAGVQFHGRRVWPVAGAVR